MLLFLLNVHLWRSPFTSDFQREKDGYEHR